MWLQKNLTVIDGTPIFQEHIWTTTDIGYNFDLLLCMPVK